MVDNLRDFSRRKPNYFEHMNTSVLDEKLFHEYLDHLLFRYLGMVPKTVVKYREIIDSRLIATGFLWNTALLLSKKVDLATLVINLKNEIFPVGALEEEKVSSNLDERNALYHANHHFLMNLPSTEDSDKTARTNFV